MKISISQQKGIYVVEVYGDLVFTNWQEMVDKVTELQGKGENRVIVLFDKVEYMDSSAMGALVSIHKTFKKIPGGRSVVVTSRDEHQFVFKQANFHTFLEIYRTMEEAFENLIPASESVNA